MYVFNRAPLHISQRDMVFAQWKLEDDDSEGETQDVLRERFGLGLGRVQLGESGWARLGTSMRGKAPPKTKPVNQIRIRYI